MLSEKLNFCIVFQSRDKISLAVRNVLKPVQIIVSFVKGVDAVLMERFRALLLTGTQFAEATCGSIRLYLVNIGAIIRRTTRQIYVALSSACPNQELLRLIAAKIIAWE